ncbi:MAG: DNA mismatch repair protein MutS, partial [Chloroflexi bacterium]|nr:DNA mismatch repair protein MutS [Chloroflexota bacterium]
MLFFRLGDFYETFDGDAELVSEALGVALTSKPMGKGLRVPLAGVPVQSAEGHLARLIAAGHRVAIAEQLEDPAARGAARGLVRRGVVRVVSPGTALEPSLLEAGRNSFCAALCVEPGGGGPARAGLALADLSTGELRGCELEADGAEAARTSALRELERLGARELLLAAAPGAEAETETGAETSDAEGEPPGWSVTPRPRDRFRAERGAALLRERFAVADVEGLGMEGRPALLGALGALLDYLGEGQGEAGEEGSDRLAHLQRPRIYDPAATMRLDAATLRALDILPGPDGGESLLGLLDRCRTAAGRRLLRERLGRPLIALEAIEARLERVALLHGSAALRERLRRGLGELPDLERLL